MNKIHLVAQVLRPLALPVLIKNDLVSVVEDGSYYKKMWSEENKIAFCNTVYDKYAPAHVKEYVIREKLVNDLVTTFCKMLQWSKIQIDYQIGAYRLLEICYFIYPNMRWIDNAIYGTPLFNSKTYGPGFRELAQELLEDINIYEREL